MISSAPLPLLQPRIREFSLEKLDNAHARVKVWISNITTPCDLIIQIKSSDSKILVDMTVVEPTDGVNSFVMHVPDPVRLTMVELFIFLQNDISGIFDRASKISNY